MASPSPPKPWERGTPTALSSSPATSSIPSSNPTSSSTPATTNSNSTSDPPPVPSKPSTLNSVVNRNASNYSPYTSSRYGASPYGGYGSYGSYSSPYSSPYTRLGAMGNSMYGGYGGAYGSMYGGMYGGMGQPGMMGVDPNDPNSLTNSMSHSTQATFQMIESLVGAFGGFAQMLESTYMATHSSFFAMVSVAEQFSNLRNTLGSILGIFTLLRWMRTLIAKITGRPPPADATALTPSAFASFQGLSSPSSPSNPNGIPTPSRKPFVIFLLAVFGLPYLMTKLIRSLAKSAEEERQQQQQRNHPFGPVLGPDGQPLPDQGYPPQQQPIDPSKLDFCRVLYDYPPSSSLPPAGSEGIDLTVKKGDLVAVLSKTDPIGNESEWWRCRARDGRMGYLPGVYLEIVQRRPPAANRQITAKGESRASTMSGSGGDGSRANSLKVEGAKVPLPAAKKVVVGEKGADNDISPESFQRGGYYS